MQLKCSLISRGVTLQSNSSHGWWTVVFSFFTNTSHRNCNCISGVHLVSQMHYFPCERSFLACQNLGILVSHITQTEECCGIQRLDSLFDAINIFIVLSRRNEQRQIDRVYREGGAHIFHYQSSRGSLPSFSMSFIISGRAALHPPQALCCDLPWQHPMGKHVHAATAILYQSSLVCNYLYILCIGEKKITQA